MLTLFDMKLVGGISVLCAVGLAAPVRAALDTPVVETPEAMAAYAEAGDPIAQYNLALSYRLGKFGPPDAAKAISWYQKAADAGVAEAQFNLGVSLMQGEGMAKDEKTGVKWLYLAASQGLFEAQLALIRSYSKGIGVEANAEKAFTWDCLARRTLELRYEQPAGKTPEPSVLRRDGFAEYTIGNLREAMGPDGTVERINSDGSRTLTRVEGLKTEVRADGIRESRFQDGSVKREFPDGRVATTDRNGTTETRFPDGTRTLEGDAKTSSGEKIRVTEKFDAAGQRISQRYKDRDRSIEQFTDGSQTHEIEAKDSEGRGVLIIDRYAKDGAQLERRLVRNDGVERKGDEIWALERWVVQPDGQEARVREKIGLGGSSYGTEVLETQAKKVAGAPAAAAASGSAPAREAVYSAPVITAPAGPTMEWSSSLGTMRQGGPSLYRTKEKIDTQLQKLAEAERDARYFPGVTAAQAQRARAAAAAYYIELPKSPQKPRPKNWLDQRISDLKAPPPPAPLVEITADLTGKYPVGMYGRELLNRGGWKHAETEHFVAHYRENSDAYPVMRFIECAYFVVAETLQLDTTRDRRKIHVFVFPDSAKWIEYTKSKEIPSSVLGFAYKDELFLGAYEDRDDYIKTLCHEAAHAVVSHYYPSRRWPLWLNEGFAEYTAIRALALRRDHKIERYLPASGGSPIDIQKVTDRIRYGGVAAVGNSFIPSEGLQTFYPDSARCVRTLLEKLPSGAFPQFANRIFAGNSLAASLLDAYGKACPSVEKFGELVNAP
jgi:hypothetical protein